MSITRSFEKQKWIFFENIQEYFSLNNLNNQQLIWKRKVRVIKKKTKLNEAWRQPVSKNWHLVPIAFDFCNRLQCNGCYKWWKQPAPESVSFYPEVVRFAAHRHSWAKYLFILDVQVEIISAYSKWLHSFDVHYVLIQSSPDNVGPHLFEESEVTSLVKSISQNQ